MEATRFAIRSGEQGQVSRLATRRRDREHPGRDALLLAVKTIVPSTLQSPPSGRVRGRAQIRWMVPVARLIFRSSPPGEEADGLAVGRPEGELDVLGPGQHPGGRRLERARPQHRGRVLGRIVLRSGLGEGPEHDLAAVGRHDRPAPEVEAPTVGRIDHEPASGRPRRRRPPKLGDRERHRDAPQDDRDGGPGPPLLPSSLALRFGRDRGLGARAFSRGASSGEDVLQLKPGRSDVGQPRARVLAQAPAQEPAHCRRRRLRQRVEVGLLRHDGGDHVGDGVPGEERPAGQHLPHDRAERPDVGPPVAGLPRACSGAMYAAVPSTTPAIVPEWRGGRLRDRRRTRVHAPAPSPVPPCARPKSSTLTLPVGRELHVRRLEVAVDDARSWASSSASAICSAIASASSTGQSRPARQPLRRGPPPRPARARGSGFAAASSSP